MDIEVPVTDLSGASPPDHMALSEVTELLIVLQFGDSFFPSGSTAFSWGLESLTVDRLIGNVRHIEEVLHALIKGRWACFERPILMAAHDASAVRDGGEIDVLCQLDRLCEAMTLNEGARTASRRLGKTQLKVHAELGHRQAMTYLHAVNCGDAIGHLPVVQGIIGCGLGLSAPQCAAMSAFGLALSVVSASIRLGLMGHLDAQRLLSGIRPVISEIQAAPTPMMADVWTATPGLDIAGMRHETRRARMFST